MPEIIMFAKPCHSDGRAKRSIGNKVVRQRFTVYYANTMGKMIGYMITWTTYGSWLQGDERGYVKDSKTLMQNNKLKMANIGLQKYPSVKLNQQQKQIAERAIIEESERINQRLFAIAVCSNHVHIVASVSKESIEQVVHRYKYSATSALHESGMQGKIWSKGFDKRFCFTDFDLQTRIKYVQSHA